MAYGLMTYADKVENLVENLDDLLSDISPTDTPLKDRLEIGIPYENMSPIQRADKLLKDADFQGKIERGEISRRSGLNDSPQTVTISGGQLLPLNQMMTTTS